MRSYLALLVALVLPGFLHAQQELSRQQVQQLFEAYNPVLMEQARQNSQLKEMLDGIIVAFLQNIPQDTLENRYTFVALVRNFTNSLLINEISDWYQKAVLYSQQSGDLTVQEAAWQGAYNTLLQIYPRVWAVSVQVKEALLGAYQSRRKNVKQDSSLTQAQRSSQLRQLDSSIANLEEELKYLRSDIGNQLVLLAQNTLQNIEMQELSSRAALQQQVQQNVKEADNLQIKTNHKKPVAE